METYRTGRAGTALPLMKLDDAAHVFCGFFTPAYVHLAMKLAENLGERSS